MSGKRILRPLTSDDAVFLELIRKLPSGEIAKKMRISTGYFYISVNRARQSKEVTDRFLRRLKEAASEVVAEIQKDLQVSGYSTSDGSTSSQVDSNYNDGNNPDMLPFLEAIVKKYSGKRLSLDQYDDFARIFLDLTRGHGEIKAIKMVLILFQD
jgi:hypothetical protein